MIHIRDLITFTQSGLNIIVTRYLDISRFIKYEVVEIKLIEGITDTALL